MVGYQPRSLITDHAAIDLDVQALQERAGFGQFPKALKVYEEGGHSGSYAEVRILNPKPNMAFSKGTAVVGFTEKDGDVLATLMEDASWGEVESVTVKILYTTSDVMSKHVDCMVGGLYSFMAGYRDGCKYELLAKESLKLLVSLWTIGEKCFAHASVHTLQI